MHGSGDNQPNVQKSSLIVWNTVAMKVFPGNHLPRLSRRDYPTVLLSPLGITAIECAVLQSISASMTFQLSGINILSEKWIVKQSEV